MVPFQHQLIYSGQRSDQSYYFSTSGCHVFTLCNSSAIFFFITLFCFYQHPSRLLSHGPKETQSLIHTCSSPPPTVQNCEVFIYIPVTKLKKSKEDCIYKRDRKSKNIAIPVRMMAYFAFSLWASFLLLLFFPPNYILSVDNFAQFEVGCRKLARTGEKKQEGGKKKFDHDSIMLVGLLICLSSPSLCITLK